MKRNILFLSMLVLFMMLFSTAHAIEVQDESQLRFAKTSDDNGNVYIGLWQNGKPAIYGVLYNEALNYCYIGGFKDGQFHTNCAPPSILLEAVGTRYQGYFRDGQPVGGALYTTDNSKYEMRMVDGALVPLATYKPFYDYEFSHIVWDDYGQSFHLFKGYYEGQPADIRNDISKTHVVAYDNGDYFIGEMYQGMPLYGLYFEGGSGDFYYGSYEFSVSGSNVVISGEKDQLYVEKVSGVVSFADTAIFDERNYPIPDFEVTGTLISSTLPDVSAEQSPAQNNVPQANATNQNPCTYCNQTGICSTCGGTGEAYGIQCILCYGGKCWWCKGTGIAPENDDSIYYPDSGIGSSDIIVSPGVYNTPTLCYSCHGSGICATCKGMGYISNMFGSYSDRIDCGGCYGLKKCQRCSGTGFE